MLQRAARSLFQGKFPKQMVMQHQQRFESVVCAKPKHPLTTFEMIFLGGGMMVGILAVPLYILVHIPRYAEAHRSS